MTIAPRVGFFGTFDTGDDGDLLLPLIFEREMTRRLPGVVITFFSPSPRATMARGGVIAEPFERCDPKSLDLIVVSGDAANSIEGERLDLAPDPRLLVADLFPRDVLERRLRQLQAMGVYPTQGRPLVVEGTIPEAAASLDVVRLDSIPMPAVQDVVAAIAHANAFDGTSPALMAIALAFGVPLFGSREKISLDPFLARLSEKFDHLASIAERRAAQRANVDVAELQRREIASLRERNDALQRAHQVLRERAAADRVVFAEAVNRAIEGDLSAATLVDHNANLLREWSHAQYARTAAEQRATVLEKSARDREARIEQLAAENVRLRDEIAETRRDVAEMRREMAALNEELTVSSEENQRHRLVLRTRIVSAALRVQYLLARLRGK